MSEMCYLVIKLGKYGDIDFLKEHKKIIDECGYVDFARVSKKRILNKYYDKTKFYIKESKASGDRLIEVLGEPISKGEKYPSYYNEILTYEVDWFRITQMKEINKEEFIKMYCKLNGDEIKVFSRGAIPFFFIRPKNN